MSNLNDLAKNLRERFEARSATVGVIGLGYVGLPLAVSFVEKGFSVLGFDVDEAKVRTLRNRRSYIESVEEVRVSAAISRGLIPTSDFSRAREADALLICVPTPLDRYREPDMSFILGTLESIRPHLRAGQLISLESTTYPGTTEEVLVPAVKEAGLSVGHDVFVVYSPEREDPGNRKYSTITIPKVVGGVTDTCLSLGASLYGNLVEKVVEVSSTRVAEMTKLLENIHRAVNIGLVNEMKMVADRMGVDIYEVIQAASTKPFGFTPYYPGPGLGGHCIPIDPFYLTWKAREYGVHTRFIELAGEVNTFMPEWVFSKIVSALNTQRSAVNGAKILVLGIAYKKDVDDVRESPAIAILKMLADQGAEVCYSDPHVPFFPKMRSYTYDLASVELTESEIADKDVVVIATDHTDFDYERILTHARLIVDTRGVYRKPHRKVVKA